MTQVVKRGEFPGISVDKRIALAAWIFFLSCILIPVAIVVNFNLGYAQFKLEMAEHWVDYNAAVQPPATPTAPAGSSAATLEKTYNAVARSLNNVCVSIAGSRAVHGIPEQVHGSGIVIADTYVLTNYHVIENASDIHVTVYVPTEVSYPAGVVATDRTNDLALMRVQTTTLLASASLANSDTVNPGDMVFAMGNAFASGNVFTSGIVCDTNQSFAVDGRAYRMMIRTETYTYPGSSGGPLANINGEIIGINTAIYNPRNKFTGISFAIPINRAAALLQRAGVSGLALAA